MRALFATSPTAALLKRELLVSLRGVKAFVLVAVLVGLCLAVVSFGWPSNVLLSETKRYAQDLFESLCFLILAAGLFILPGLAASSIVSEREQETLDMLYVTLIPPRGIIVGKLLNTIGFFMLLIISVLPVFGLVFFLVGIEWQQVAKAMTCILLATLTCSMIGLLCSAYFHKSLTAALGAYLGTAFFLFGPMLAVTVLSTFYFNRKRSLNQMLEMAINIQPFGTLKAAFGSWINFDKILLGFGYQTCVLLFCLLLLARVLKRPPQPPKVETGKPIDDVEELKRRRKTFPYYLLDPLKRKKPIDDNANPMRVKEIRWGLANRAPVMIRLSYIAFIVYLFTGIMTAFASRTFLSMLPFLLVQISLTVALTPILLANTFTKEYETGNMDILRMTLLKPKEIVFGKFYAGVCSVLPVALAAVSTSLIVGHEWMPVLIAGWVTLFVSILLSVSIGLYASLCTRKTTSSIMLSYALNIFLFYGLVLLVAFSCEALAKYYRAWSDFRRYTNNNAFYFFFSPICAFGYNADLDHGNNVINFYWISNMMIFLTLCLIFLRVSVGRFSKMMRDR